MKLYGMTEPTINDSSATLYELWGINGVLSALWFFTPRLGFEKTAVLVALASAMNSVVYARIRHSKILLARRPVLWALISITLAAIIGTNYQDLADPAIKAYAALELISGLSSILLPRIYLTKSFGE
jgi:hypothetical protein